MFIPGSGFRLFPHPGSGSRIQGLEKHRIRIRNAAFQAKAFSFSTTGTGIVLTEYVAFRGVNFTVNNVELVVQSNVVVLAVKPHLYHQVHHPFLSHPIAFHPVLSTPTLPFPSHSILSLPPG
jgi:hypothetical protein